ncbi:MAG: S49 family peptidase [Hyphomicrobiaceae bacterium]|nr:S49 family peptidase [Hyphomicrobiaceae bacterium]
MMERGGQMVRDMLGRGGPVVPAVRLYGAIAAGDRPNRINIETVNPLLEQAFKIKSAPAVAIVINSPGGSAVQSRLVSKRIRELADRHEKPALVFVEDVAASGGYFIAVAGDEIFADPSSIVGSIGVIMATFGFEEAIKKLGISRRLYTAGKNKSTLDPFLPEKKEDVERIKTYELDIHQVFIDWVKAHRGARLTAPDDELFTGEFWTATRGLDMGLIDGIGDIYEVVRNRFGDDAKIKWMKRRRPLFSLSGFGLGSSASSIAGDLAAEVEDRALWARFGL